MFLQEERKVNSPTKDIPNEEKMYSNRKKYYNIVRSIEKELNTHKDGIKELNTPWSFLTQIFNLNILLCF